MIRAMAPIPCTLIALICMSTGRAFSTGVFIQPPAPKLSPPPSMTRPEPMSWQLAARSWCWLSVKASLGTLARITAVIRLKLRQVGGQRVAADAARAVDLGGGQDLDLDFLLAQGLTSSACSPRVPSIKSTWALPRAWVNPSAMLLIARLSPLPLSGMNSAEKV